MFWPPFYLSIVTIFSYFKHFYPLLRKLFFFFFFFVFFFSKFGLVNVFLQNESWYFGRHYEKVTLISFFFYQSPRGKVLFKPRHKWISPCAQTGVKSSLRTLLKGQWTSMTLFPTYCKIVEIFLYPCKIDLLLKKCEYF